MGMVIYDLNSECTSHETLHHRLFMQSAMNKSGLLGLSSQSGWWPGIGLQPINQCDLATPINTLLMCTHVHTVQITSNRVTVIHDWMVDGVS